jgi:hypothetical protein
MDTALLTKKADLGRSVAEAYAGRRSFWWDIGAKMIERGAGPEEVREAIEVSGRVCSVSANYFARMRRCVRRCREAGFSKQDVKGCPLSHAAAALRKLKGGDLSRRETKTILRAHQRAIGDGPSKSQVENAPEEILRGHSPDNPDNLK